MEHNHQTEQAGEASESSGQASDKESIYTCPIHPEIEEHGPGSCPICHMFLVPKADLASGSAHGAHGEHHHAPHGHSQPEQHHHDHDAQPSAGAIKIGQAHVRNPVTNAHHVF